MGVVKQLTGEGSVGLVGMMEHAYFLGLPPTTPPRVTWLPWCGYESDWFLGFLVGGRVAQGVPAK